MPRTFSITSDDLNRAWVVPQYQSVRLIKEWASSTDIEFARLGDLVKIDSGQYITSKDYSDKGVFYIRVDNIRNHILNLTKEDIVSVPKDYLKIVTERSICQPGDILISRTGTLGKAALFRNEKNSYIVSQHVTRLSIKNEKKILPGVLALFLNSPLGRMQLVNAGMGSTRPEIPHASLAELQIPIIPISKQKQYNKELIDLLDRYYENVYRIGQCIKQAEVVLGLNNINGEYSQNDICRSFSIDVNDLNNLWQPKRYKPESSLSYKRIKKEFTCMRLGEIAKISRGKGTRVNQYQDSGIHFIRTSSLINHSLDPFPDHYASLETYQQFDQPVLDGDIIYTIEGKVGFASMLMSSMPIVFKNHIELIRLKQKATDFKELSGWIFLTLSGALGRAQVNMYSVVQSTIPGLGSKLRQFIIPVGNKDNEKNEKMKDLGKTVYGICEETVLLIKKINNHQNKFENYISAPK